MPAIAPRQSRTESNSGLTPLRIAGIVLVIVLALFFIGLFVWRRRQRKRRAAAGSADSMQRARRLVKAAFPRPSPQPPLPPYEPPREGQDLQNNGSGGEAATMPTVPPPARQNTPPDYGAHVMDRPAGPISDAPPLYQEHDQQTWGRSGCVR